MFAIGFLLFIVCAFTGWAKIVDMQTEHRTWPQFFVALGTFVGGGCMVMSVVIKAWEMMP